MSRRLTCLGWIVLSLVSAPLLAEEGLEVKLRQRLARPGNAGEFRVVDKTAAWDPQRTAIVIVDMWDDHHCKSAAARVAEMAPQMNKVVAAARDRGVLIIHSPSDCMEHYKDTPARKRAMDAPFADAGTSFQWNHFDPQCEGGLADKLEKGGCACDTPEPCSPSRRTWKCEIDTLTIDQQRDAISDKGQEVYNLLQQRGIDNVIIMGVHTNRCVLGRPFGIRQMNYVGKNVVLCRDLTDSYHRDPGHHFEGLRKIVAHIETYWCPTITSDALTGGKPFRFAKDETHDE